MLTAAVGYVSLKGLGSESESLKTLTALVGEIRAFNAALGSRAANFSAALVKALEEAEDHGLESARYQSITGGVFPFVYFTLTYDPQKLPPDKLVEWEKLFELKVTGRTSTRLDILGL